MQQYQAQQQGCGAPPHSGMRPPNPQEVVVSETIRPLNSATAINAGLPVLVRHSSSLVSPQPAGHLIPTNVRPPQCLAAAGTIPPTNWVMRLCTDARSAQHSLSASTHPLGFHHLAPSLHKKEGVKIVLLQPSAAPTFPLR